MKKFLSVVLALVMTMSLVTITAGAKDFTDKSKITYGQAVDVISSVKIIDGYSDGSFNPSATLTRGAAAKIICNLILGPTTGASLGADAAPFKDVPVSNVFSGYIAYCSQQGIINGYADGTFKPAGTVTGFQFMKMLLGALGYDGKVEGFTGANWSVAVAKLAVSIGLDDDNDNFVGSAAMTREEACLYALNTLQAKMVSYDNSGTSITVGGTTITTGASKAKTGDKTFMATYFSKLTVASSTTPFGAPSKLWKLDGVKIGNYAKTAKLTYTEETKISDIYADLGLSAKPATLNYSIDGADKSSSFPSGGLTKSNSTKIGGRGALISVYYTADKASTDDVDDVATITVVNTYLGKVSSITAATKTDDRYVTIAGIGTAAAAIAGDFDTENFAKKDYVLFTSAKGSSGYEVQSAVAATSVTGTLTSYSGTDSEMIGGTTYKNSAMCDTNGSAYVTGGGTLKDEVTAYLDSHGYVLDLVTSEAAEGSYAYVLQAGNAGSTDFTNYQAKLLFTDGTTKTVDTKSNYSGLLDNWITYTVNSDSKYVLKDASTSTTGATAAPFLTTNSTSAFTSNDKTFYANDSTIFVVDKPTGTYTVYTGYKNVPSIFGTDSKTAASLKSDVVCKSGSVANYVYVNVGSATMTGSTKDLIYIVGDKDAAHTVDSDSDYYTFNAVINGKADTVKVDATADANATILAALTKTNPDNVMLSGMTKDKYDVATLGSTTGTTVTGIDEPSKGTVAVKYVGTAYTDVLALASDVAVFYVNTDGKITESDIDAITADTNDLVTYNVKDGAVDTIIIQQVDNVKA